MCGLFESIHISSLVLHKHARRAYFVQLYIFQPPHHKTNEVACAPSEDSDQPGHPLSLMSSRRKRGSFTTHIATAKTLIRLGECPG